MRSDQLLSHSVVVPRDGSLLLELYRILIICLTQPNPWPLRGTTISCPQQGNSSSPAQMTTRSSSGRCFPRAPPLATHLRPLPSVAASSSPSRGSRATSAKSRTSHSAQTAGGQRARRRTTPCACGTAGRGSSSRPSGATSRPFTVSHGARIRGCS